MRCQNLLIRVMIVGNSQVGKSSIYSELCRRHSQNPRGITDFFFDSIVLGGITYICQLWDITYKNNDINNYQHKDKLLQSDIVLIVYDITDNQSYNSALNILEHLQNDNKPIIYLVGNKIDLHHFRQVSFEEAKQFSDSLGIKFKEISTFKPNEIYQDVYKFYELIAKKRMQS